MLSNSIEKEILNICHIDLNSKTTGNQCTTENSDNEDFSAKLPPEILLNIFKFVSKRDLQRSVAMVNRRWHQLVRDPTMLKVLRLSKKAPLEVIKLYISQRPLLSVLKASGLELINESMQYIVVGCPFLVCLDIGFCEISELTILLICQYGQNLKHINLEGVSVNHDMIDLLCTCLPQLEILNLSHCSNLNDETMHSISEKLSNLKAINIDGIQNISDFGLVWICNKHYSYLNWIWIDGCELGNIGLQALTGCICLTFLSISYADTLSDDAVVPIRSLSNLKFLTIHKATQLSKPAMLDLFRIDDCQLTKLISLDLNECSVIDDEVLNSILNICGKDLRVLSLQWCWNITDNGIDLLVSTSLNMERLSLIGNHIIRGHSFRYLPGKWVYLKSLNLTNCNQIDDELMKNVARLMPSTYIFDYFGERFSDHDDNITQYDYARIMEKLPICDHF